MSITSQAYLDVVGDVERSWGRAYDTCIMHSCPRCGADAYYVCVNPISRRKAKMPCLARIAQTTLN
jgi:hypothetical protein